MTYPLTSARVICTACFGQNPRCAKCFGAQYVEKHPYAAIEQGFRMLEPHEVPPGQAGAKATASASREAIGALSAAPEAAGFDDGIDPADVAAVRVAIGQAATVSLPVAEWRRIRELARLCRSPENSGPLAELLGRIEGARHG